MKITVQTARSDIVIIDDLITVSSADHQAFKTKFLNYSSAKTSELPELCTEEQMFASTQLVLQAHSTAEQRKKNYSASPSPLSLVSKPSQNFQQQTVLLKHSREKSEAREGCSYGGIVVYCILTAFLQQKTYKDEH